MRLSRLGCLGLLLLGGCATTSSPKPENVPPPIIEVDPTPPPAPSDETVEGDTGGLASDAEVVDFVETGDGVEDEPGRVLGPSDEEPGPPFSGGAGGLGLKGSGRGGGGTAEQLQGLGSLGSSSSGGNDLSRIPGGGSPPRVRIEKATSDPGLPRAVVRRVVRKHMGSFRYCYEQGLHKDPDLAGSVVVRFVIEPNGEVSSSRGSGDLDTAVAACVAGRFLKMRFPKPRGGKIHVKYPIRFSSPQP